MCNKTHQHANVLLKVDASHSFWSCWSQTKCDSWVIAFTSQINCNPHPLFSVLAFCRLLLTLRCLPYKAQQDGILLKMLRGTKKDDSGYYLRQFAWAATTTGHEHTYEYHAYGTLHMSTFLLLSPLSSVYTILCSVQALALAMVIALWSVHNIVTQWFLHQLQRRFFWG